MQVEKCPFCAARVIMTLTGQCPSCRAQVYGEGTDSPPQDGGLHNPPQERKSRFPHSLRLIGISTFIVGLMVATGAFVWWQSGTAEYRRTEQENPELAMMEISDAKINEFSRNVNGLSQLGAIKLENGIMAEDAAREMRSELKEMLELKARADNKRFMDRGLWLGIVAGGTATFAGLVLVISSFIGFRGKQP